MRRATAGMVLAAALLAIATIRCGAVDADYFGSYEPTWVRVPVTLGDGAYVGITVLAAHPGEVVVLESVEFDGREGDATIEALVAVLGGDTRLIGAVAESQMDAGIDLAAYRPARGARFAVGDGPVALAALIRGTSPIHGFRGVTIRFQVEGSEGIRFDQIPFRATVCSGAGVEAAVHVCRPIEDQMQSFGA